MKTVAFYSYKGGVGRSLFVANLSLFLAHFAAKKVLVLDMDLEAPGMPYKFEAAGVHVPPIAAGIVDTLRGYLPDPHGSGGPTEKLPIVELWSSPTGGSVHLYAAGPAPRTVYWQKLSEIDFRALARDSNEAGVDLFYEVHERIREEFSPDIVLIDARTGVSDIAGAATQVMAQQAFCLMLDEAEHREGMRAVMRGFARCPRIDGEGLIQVVPVLSRVHTKYGSPEELALREKVRGFLNEAGPSLEETLSITAPNDIVVLHNDDNVYRTGRVLRDDLLRGGADHPSRLVADYYGVGLQPGFLEVEERSHVRNRVFHAESITPHFKSITLHSARDKS